MYVRACGVEFRQRRVPAPRFGALKGGGGAHLACPARRGSPEKNQGEADRGCVRPRRARALDHPEGQERWIIPFGPPFWGERNMRGADETENRFIGDGPSMVGGARLHQRVRGLGGRCLARAGSVAEHSMQTEIGREDGTVAELSDVRFAGAQTFSADPFAGGWMGPFTKDAYEFRMPVRVLLPRSVA